MAVQALDEWEHFFKPEVRNSGRALFIQDKISASHPSDTEIQGFAKGATAFKVALKLSHVQSPRLMVDCTCPASKKGQFCKHIWATLLKVEKSYPDFLEDKKEIEKMSGSAEAPASRPQTQSQIDSQAAYKAKQNDYRHQQYQKQKLKLKEQKASKKNSKLLTPRFPEAVEKAVLYFAENGFPMEPLNSDNVRLAKKKLSQVFHPDKGGNHNEILELNENYEVLMGYLGN